MADCSFLSPPNYIWMAICFWCWTCGGTCVIFPHERRTNTCSLKTLTTSHFTKVQLGELMNSLGSLTEYRRSVAYRFTDDSEAPTLPKAHLSMWQLETAESPEPFPVPHGQSHRWRVSPDILTAFNLEERICESCKFQKFSETCELFIFRAW